MNVRNISPLALALSCAGLAISTAHAELMPLDEALVARSVDAKCNINKKNDYECTSRVELTVLKNEARDLVSRIDLPFLEDDVLEVVRAEVTQPGKKPEPVSKDAIDTKTEPNPQLGFTRNKQTSIAFNRIMPGTKITYVVHTINRNKPFMPEFDIHEYPGTRQLMRTEKYHYEVTADRPIFYKTEDFDQFEIKLADDKKKLTITLKQPATWAYIRESSSSYQRVMPHINLASSEQIGDHYRLIGKKYVEISEQPLPPQAAALVKELGDASPGSKINRIMQFIYQHYRYLGDWRASDRGIVPFDLAKIEKHGYGDCKDLSILLVAMLKKAGIDANPALVYRGVFAPNVLIPGINNANHAIVRAVVNDKTLWLDPTNPYFIQGYTESDISDRWTFIIHDDGSVKLDHIDANPITDPSLHYSETELKPDQTAKVTGRYSATGYDSQIISVNLQDRQSSQETTNRMLCSSLGEQSHDCTFTPRKSDYLLPERNTIEYTFVDDKPAERISPRRYLMRTSSVKVFNDLIRYAKENQALDYYLGEPGINKYDVTLKNVQLMDYPQACKIQSPSFDVSLNTESVQSKRTLHYILELTSKRRWLTRDEIRSPEFQKQLRKSIDCLEQLNLILETQPKETAEN